MEPVCTIVEDGEIYHRGETKIAEIKNTPMAATDKEQN